MIFERVVVGIDGSPESREAARQASALLAPAGTLTLVAAYQVPPPRLGVVAPEFAPVALSQIEHDAAERALSSIAAGLPAETTVTTTVARGFASDELLKVIKEHNATLVAIGSHGVGRLVGIATVSTATHVMHRASCSVLIARAAGEHFPQRVVVGIDGSPQSAAAYAAARALSERVGAELRPLVAARGQGVDEVRAASIAPNHEVAAGDPLRVLVSASRDADLIVVGSRGLHGLKALGSVSERVAHQAHCSTLIVRASVADR